MKNINQLVNNILIFSNMAESNSELAKYSAEHALERSEERLEDKRLAEPSKDHILQAIYTVQNNKAIFDKIPLNSKWIVESFNGAKGIVQKIEENRHTKFIYKTLLKSEYSEDASGRLVDIVKYIVEQNKQEKVKDNRKTIKAVEKLLGKTLPISVSQIKATTAPEYWMKLKDFFNTLRDQMITKESIEAYIKNIS